MAKGHPIFNSFSAGEISPRVWSRSDLKGWRNGVAAMINMIATSHGPAMRRGGMEYLGQSVATVGRTFTLQHTKLEAYMVGITETDIQIFNVSDGVDPPVLEQTIGAVPWIASEIPLIYSDVPPGGKEIDFVSPNVAPHELVFDPDGTIPNRWTLAPMTIANGPSEWGANNYPSAIAFYQGRMWVAGTNDEPEQFWATRPGTGDDAWPLFRDFNTTSATADFALDFTLSKQGKIEWLRAAQSLVLGTANGEHIVTADQQVITANDIDVDQQSSYGSKDIQAQLIGNVVIYVSPDGRKLRDVGYQWEENAWLSRDITFLSEHITKGNEIKEIAWAQQPDNVIWGVTEQGNLLGCTYERHYDVIGWHRHDTQGDFQSVSTVDVKGTSNAFFAVGRVAGLIYFERYQGSIGSHEKEFMDSHIHFDLAGGVEIAGVTHLADQTVAVTVDEATHPDVTLDSNGDATLQYAGQEAIVGLSYLPQMVTLPLDYTPEESGTSQHFMKRWSRIFVRILESAQPLIGKDRPPVRHPLTPMNTPEPLIQSQDIKVLATGWDRRAQIYIEQDLPLAMTVTGIYGEAAQEMDD